MSPWAGRLPDPRAPWLAPYRELCRRLAAEAPGEGPVAQRLNAVLSCQPEVTLKAGPLRFVGQAELGPDEAYESFVARTATVPTRDTLHDLCNGLVWLRHPNLKRRLNELHAGQIAADGVGAVRGPVRDALTLFDENAALWQAPVALADALAARDWHTLFIARRSLWRDARPLLVGHALIEKLCWPRKPITAHVWLVPEGVDAADHMVEWLTPTRLTTRSHLALPVLGVPGWWPDNEAPAFYDDPGVFRRRPVAG